MKYPLDISNFLGEISSFSHSVVFLYSFALITEEGFLISPCYSLELCIQRGYIFPFLLCFLLLFFSQLFVRPPQTAILLFCISFPWGWSWSLSPVQCHSLAYEITQPMKTNHTTFHSCTHLLWWPTLCGVWSSLNLNKSTSYLSLCLSLNSFSDETSRTWASLGPETRYHGFWLGLSPSTWVWVPARGFKSQSVVNSFSATGSINSTVT